MRRPDPMATGSGFSDTADGSSKIRRAGLSDRLTPGDISAALYGPTIRDRYGEPIEPEPILSAAEIRRRRHEREVRQAARRLEAAVDAELRRRDDG